LHFYGEMADEVAEKAWQRAGLTVIVSTPARMGNLLAMSDDDRADAIATTGLFLNFIAVIAGVICLASWGTSDAMVAAPAGAVALLSFSASIACFRAQADEQDQQEIPVG